MCPILHIIYQITLSNKYFIPIYKRLGLFNFPAQPSVPSAGAKHEKDFLRCALAKWDKWVEHFLCHACLDTNQTC